MGHQRYTESRIVLEDRLVSREVISHVQFAPVIKPAVCLPNGLTRVLIHGPPITQAGSGRTAVNAP